MCCFPKKTWGTITGYADKAETLPLKIFEMGLIPGIKFRLLCQAPFHGPIMLEYGEEKSRLALRQSEAALILVSEDV